MRPFGTQRQLERRRRRAIELLREGMSLTQTAGRIGCAVSAVFYWRQAYHKNGKDGLQSKPVPGRPPKLNRTQKKKLTRLLLKGPLSCGFATDLWTQKRIGQVIAKEFGIGYHPNHLWRFLIRLGWSCQKPEKRARERDEEKIRRWKRWAWPHIKKGQAP
ncbi:MAG: IS630 family transposase [Elusimicrobia bacterium]|nr:IS630 family transposase [Elusimicrobiota bacterium]